MPMQSVFTGKTAKITLNAAAAQASSAGAANAGAGGGQLPPERDAANKVLSSSYFGGAPPVVGRATGVHVAVTTNLQEFHEIGRRHPVVLHPGDISISGSIDRAYVSGALITLLLGQGVTKQGAAAEPFAQPAFDITVALNDPAKPGPNGNPTAELVLSEVKFHNWAFRIPEDDFVMENVTFRALSFEIVDQPAPPDGDGKAINPFG